MEYGFNANNVYGFWAKQGTGFIGSAVLASIIYNMDRFNVDSSSLRTIDNAGREGQLSDSPMYASNHIFLDGSTQSVDYVTVSGSDYVYFDVTTKAHISGTAVGATTNITASHSNFTSLKGGASVVTADLTYLDVNPESIARLVDGETVAGLSFDLSDIEAFYPANDGEASGAYVQDVIQLLGTEQVVNGDFATDTVWVKGIGWTISGGSANCDGTQTAESFLRQDNILTIGNTEHATIDVIVTSGSIALSCGASPRLIMTSSGSYGTIQVTDPLDDLYIIASSDFVGSVDNISIREATASEILNYASTCRTNLDLTNYGASNLLYKQDATGRWLGMADANLIEFTGDGRKVPTGWTIKSSEDWTLEYVHTFTAADGNYYLSGGTGTSAWLGQSNLGNVFATVGGVGFPQVAVSAGLNKVDITFNSSTLEAKLYVNGVLSNTRTVSSWADYVFYLGGATLGTTNLCISPLGSLKVHKNKTMTTNEVAYAYTQAKVAYPTLP